jgi:NAD(P)-dependent dehydrogenase (short-subunit alcohol dehydrogenase family)
MPRNEVICIYGCSSGIGRALAERLAAQGASVYAC